MSARETIPVLCSVYITRYGLSKGIVEKQAERCGEKMIRVKTGSFTEYFHAGDWYETRQAAEARVRDMVARRLQGIERERKRLVKLGVSLGMDLK